MKYSGRHSKTRNEFIDWLIDFIDLFQLSPCRSSLKLYPEEVTILQKVGDKLIRKSWSMKVLSNMDGTGLFVGMNRWDICNWDCKASRRKRYRMWLWHWFWQWTWFRTWWRWFWLKAVARNSFKVLLILKNVISWFNLHN